MGKKTIVVMIVLILVIFSFFRYQEGSLAIPSITDLKDTVYGAINNDDNPPISTAAPTTAAPSTPTATTGAPSSTAPPNTASPTPAPTFPPKPTDLLPYDYVMAGNSAAHTNQSANDLPPTPSLLWSYDLSSSPNNLAEPAVGYGNAYIYADNGILSCIDMESGLLVWEQDVPGTHYHTPALGNGSVYVATSEGVFSFNAATGTPQWSYESISCPSIDPMFWSLPSVEQVLYCAGDKVAALDPSTGTLLWSYVLPGEARSSPSMGYDSSAGTSVILVATSSHLHVIDKDDGSPIKTIAVSSPTNVMSVFDIWYVNSGGGIVEFFNSGSINAIAQPSNPSITSGASATATVTPMEYYYYSADGHLYYMLVGASQVWKEYIGDDLVNGPLIGMNNVYLSFSDGTVRSYSRFTGDLSWSMQLVHPADFCLAHDRLFVVSGGLLTCYG